jgi:ferredoxin
MQVLSMAIKVNKDVCIGCGVCASLCGEVFVMKNGKSHVKAQKNLPCVKEAISSCPVGAISK